MALMLMRPGMVREAIALSTALDATLTVEVRPEDATVAHLAHTCPWLPPRGWTMTADELTEAIEVLRATRRVLVRAEEGRG